MAAYHSQASLIMKTKQSDKSKNIINYVNSVQPDVGDAAEGHFTFCFFTL